MTEVATGPQPGACGDQRVVSLDACEWSCLAEPGDAAVDEAGVGGAQRLRAEPPPVHRAWRESLDQHVGGRHQLVEVPAALFGAEVGDDALLAAVPHQEAVRVHGAQPVAVGQFHLDDPRARVGQDHPGHRRGDARRPDLDHVEAGTDLSHRSPWASTSWSRRVYAIIRGCHARSRRATPASARPTRSSTRAWSCTRAQPSRRRGGSGL